VDKKVDELEKEDQFIVTIVMSKGILREIVLFQEKTGVHTA
jgi:hypothetical protein